VEWSDRCQEQLQQGGLHELLTHVVDETSAICDGIGRELLGEGSAAAPSPAPQ
jgi:hypothetical protein